MSRKSYYYSLVASTRLSFHLFPFSAPARIASPIPTACNLEYKLLLLVVVVIERTQESTHDQPCNVSQYTRAVSFCGSRARVIMI